MLGEFGLEGVTVTADELAELVAGLGLGEKDAEDLDIPLPSSFDNVPSSMSSALRKEISLRIAQANDALEGVRSDIGHKSFLYRSNIRLADGKKQRSRGYAAVKSTDKSMRHHIRMYN